MGLSSAAIISSGKTRIIKKCLQHLKKQTKSFSKIVVIVWGKHKEDIKEVIDNLKKEHKELKQVEILLKPITQGIANGRNAGIKYLEQNGYKIDYVAFLDDDTFIRKDWLENMQRLVSESNSNKIVYASVVTFNYNPSIIQSCGHYFGEEAKPFDEGYMDSITELYFNAKDYKPKFPCANCAYIPWDAIKKIKENENNNNAWDEFFPRMTCFDFGLKLYLLNYKCVLAQDSLAKHVGYHEKKTKSIKQLLQELESRILLYEKFFPKENQLKAMSILENNYVKDHWSRYGYSGADYIKGADIELLYECAKKKAENNFSKINKIWKKKAEALGKLECEKLFFNGF